MQQHIFRERHTPNADSSKPAPVLIYGFKDAQSAVESHLSNLGITPRLNAVKALDVLLTASPGYFRDEGQGPGEWNAEKLDRWTASQVEYIRQRFGSDNVVQMTLHLDEATPHIHAIVVPITQDRRLSARDVVGNRHKLRDLQTDYAKAMQPLGLERGVEGSRATHQTVKRWYAETEKALQKDLSKGFNLAKPKILERPEDFARREVNRYIEEFARPLDRKLAQALKQADRLADIEPSLPKLMKERDAANQRAADRWKLLHKVATHEPSRQTFLEHLEEYNAQKSNRETAERSKKPDKDQGGPER